MTKKTETMTEPVAGQYITKKMRNRLWEDVDKLPASEDFKEGACFAFAFMAMRKEADVHGCTIAEVYEDYTQDQLDMLKELIPEPIRELIDKINAEGNGASIGVHLIKVED